MVAKLFTLTATVLAAVQGHVKLVWPSPRLDSANVKTGPCGSEDFTDGDITEIAAGTTITIEVYEQVYHTGAPMRVALSHVQNDSYSDCILLNHIPQHTTGTEANARFIDVEIPDVNCSLCALQIVSVMADKIDDGAYCEYHVDGGGSDADGDCWSNYQSCANVKINGTTNREDLECSQPDDWPYSDLTWNMYTQEESDDEWCVTSSSPLELRLITNGTTCSSSGTDTTSTSAAPSVMPTSVDVDTSTGFGFGQQTMRFAVATIITGWLLV